jgi:hypothetical protein
MTITIRGSSDEALRLMKKALREYQTEYPAATITLYRHNSISIRIRVIDPDFDGMELSDRHSRIWEYLEKLPEEIQSDISMIVLLAPGEVKRSLGNLEFENPSPSLIK